MKLKKTLMCLLCIVICAAIFAVGLTACSNNEQPTSEKVETVTIDGKTYKVAPTGVDISFPTKLVDGELEIRADMLIGNTTGRCAHYVNCRLSNVYMRPAEEVDEEGRPLYTSYFDDCAFFGVSFERLAEDAEIIVNGKTEFNNCVFLPGQKLIIDSDCTFNNCENVSLYPAEGRDYNIEVNGSSISFYNYSKINYDIKMIGGSVTLPEANLVTNFKMRCNGTDITIPTSAGMYNSVEAVGCVVNALDEIMFRKIEASTINFGKTSNKTARLRFGTYIGNEIVTNDYKDTLILGGNICANNYINGVNSAHNSYVTMQKGTSGIDKCSVCSGNFNGATVL